MSLNFDFPFFKGTDTSANVNVEIKRLPESQAGQLLKAKLKDTYLV